jgi:serine/threonine protein kinase
MIWLIDALKIIHSRGIVHGDIHARNVAWRQGSDSELVLIDFGLSATSQELSLNNPKPYEVEHLHCLHSQWQLDGWRSSFRDDMYRVLLLGSFLLNGMKFFEYGGDLEIDRDAMIDFKKNGMIFAIPGSRVVIDPQTRAVFEELLVHVRGLTYMDTPDYALMRSALKRVPLSSQFSH